MKKYLIIAALRLKWRAFIATGWICLTMGNVACQRFHSRPSSELETSKPNSARTPNAEAENPPSESIYEVVVGIDLGKNIPTPPQYSVHPVQFEIIVPSKGCTRDNDFMVELTQQNNRQILQLQRIQEDFCEAYPHNVSITKQVNNFVREWPVFYGEKPVRIISGYAN